MTAGVGSEGERTMDAPKRSGGTGWEKRRGGYDVGSGDNGYLHGAAGQST